MFIVVKTYFVQSISVEGTCRSADILQWVDLWDYSLCKGLLSSLADVDCMLITAAVVQRNKLSTERSALCSEASGHSRLQCLRLFQSWEVFCTVYQYKEILFIFHNLVYKLYSAGMPSEFNYTLSVLFTRTLKPVIFIVLIQLVILAGGVSYSSGSTLGMNLAQCNTCCFRKTLLADGSKRIVLGLLSCCSVACLDTFLRNRRFYEFLWSRCVKRLNLRDFKCKSCVFARQTISTTDATLHLLHCNIHRAIWGTSITFL